MFVLIVVFIDAPFLKFLPELIEAARAAGEQTPKNEAVGIRPARESWKPLLSPVTGWKLPPGDASDDDARVLADGLKFGIAGVDHERVVRSKRRGNLRECAGAVGIHLVCARCGPGTDVAVLARREYINNAAAPVEGCRTDVGVRPNYGWERGSNNGSNARVCERALDAGVRASLVGGVRCGRDSQNECGGRAIVKALTTALRSLERVPGVKTRLDVLYIIVFFMWVP